MFDLFFDPADMNCFEAAKRDDSRSCLFAPPSRIDRDVLIKNLLGYEHNHDGLHYGGTAKPC